MTIISYRLFQFEIPLNKNIQVKNNYINQRSGIIIEFRDDQNIAGYGECAPLPGLHYYKIDKIVEDIDRAAGDLVNENIEFDNRKKIMILKKYPNKLIHFALESTLLNLLSCRLKKIDPGLNFNRLRQIHNEKFFSAKSM